MTQEITFAVIFKMLLRHFRLILILAVVGAIIGFGYAYFLVTPTYSSSGVMLIQNTNYDDTATAASEGATQPVKIYSSDFSSSATLAKNCSILFTTDPGMKEIIAGNSLNIVSIDETSFLRVTITSRSRTVAKEVVNKVLVEAENLYKETFPAGRLKIISYGSETAYASTQGIKEKTIIGIIIGIVLACVIAFILELIDSTIKPDDDLYTKYGIPVFAEIIDFDNISKELDKES